MNTPANNRAQIYILNLTGQENEDTVNQLMQLLPAANLQRFSLYTNLRSKLQSLAGEVLARYATGKYAGKSFNLSEMKTGKNGKPYFTDQEHIHFNISHSGHYIVCAVNNTNIGIDVERIRKVNLRIAERYFSPKELHDLLQLSDTESMEYFIRLWTIKESYLKAKGTGLTQKLNSFTIEKSLEGFQLTGSTNAQMQEVISIKLDTDFYMAVCSLKPLQLEETNFMSTSDLMIK